MAKLFAIDLDTDKVVDFVPGPNGLRMVLKDDIQPWVDDGRIASLSLPTQVIIGSKSYTWFRFRDRRLATMFKLTFG